MPANFNRSTTIAEISAKAEIACQSGDYFTALTIINTSLAEKYDNISARELLIHRIPLLQLRAQIYVFQKNYDAALHSTQQALDANATRISSLEPGVSDERAGLEELYANIEEKITSHATVQRLQNELHVAIEQKSTSDTVVLVREILNLDPTCTCALAMRERLLNRFKNIINLLDNERDKPLKLQQLKSCIKAMLFLQPDNTFALNAQRLETRKSPLIILPRKRSYQAMTADENPPLTRSAATVLSTSAIQTVTPFSAIPSDTAATDVNKKIQY